MSEGPPLSGIERLLASMERISASDLHIKVGSPPIYRVNGTPQRTKSDPITYDQATQMIYGMLSEKQKAELDQDGSTDFARSVHGSGRFRINVFKQRGAPSLVARRVNSVIPDFQSLMLPKAINRIPSYHDGLVLVVGITGSGKSTTLASIIDRISSTRKCHILTIEDPIEYVYGDEKAFINQREVGTDAPNFHIALRHAMRQDPDVILIGEMRDSETVETSLSASETGHLVLGTLHATNCLQTMSRILEFFPRDRQDGIRQVLSYTLRAVIAQKLLPGLKPEMPRVPAVELMIVNAVIRKHIADGEDHKIPDDIRSALKDGLQDFNTSLYSLVKGGLVDANVALERSPNPEALQMQLKGMSQSTA